MLKRESRERERAETVGWVHISGLCVSSALKVSEWVSVVIYIYIP